MFCLEDLKRRRCEWMHDGLSRVMLDSHDCLHCVSMIWPVDGSSAKRWALAWVFIDSPYGLPQIASGTWATPEDAMAWVDACFAEHFEWFEREAA